MCLAVAAAYQMVMEEVRIDSVMAVQKCTITVFCKLNFLSCHSKYSLAFLVRELPLEVLGYDGAQEAEGFHLDNWGVTQGHVGRWGCVLPEIHNHLHCL